MFHQLTYEQILFNIVMNKFLMWLIELV